MASLKEKLKNKLSNEDYQFLLQILDLPPSKVRGFIEDKVKEVLNYDGN